MSTDQATLEDISSPTARERALQGGARYRGGRPSGQCPTGNHGGGSCGNCGATPRDEEMDDAIREWWRVFAPEGGPERCPQCMNGLQQDHAAVALGERVPEEMHGVRD